MEINKQDIEKEREIIKELKQQLADKDKEIKQLKQEIENNQRDYVSELAYYTAEENIKQIRHQVCEEIREELKYSLNSIYTILDRI